MDYDKIIEVYFPNASSIKKSDFKRWISFFYNSLSGISPKEALLDETFICKLFYTLKTGHVSRSQYFKVKEYLNILSKYFEVNINIPTHEKVLSSQEFNTFFLNLEDIIEFIDNIGCYKIIGYDDDFMVLKAIVVLGWHGFTLSELTEILKEDIYAQTTGEYYLKFNNNTIYLKKFEFDILEKLSKANYYHRGIIRDETKIGKTCYFKGDDKFLFRPTSSSENKIKDYHLSQTIARFNSLAEPCANKSIIFRNLKRNALFVQVYEDNNTNLTPLQKIQKHTNLDNINMCVGYLNQYKKWVDIFHKEEKI